jgi:predicted GIY-YIG superfamily endonuclease
MFESVFQSIKTFFEEVYSLFNGGFNNAWSEGIYHEIKDELHDVSTKRTYRQMKRILKFADVPDSPGIYLIRDTYKTNIYVGQTYDQGLRERLSQHLRGIGSKSLLTGQMYEIRWAKTYGGKEITLIAEALAVLYFSPEGNVSKDWKGNLKRALEKEMSSQVFGEAKRLGLLRGSTKSKDDYIRKLFKSVGGRNR